ncbi:MAG: B12-binding domain-containing radical SAM protein [Planctomycetes bacterium]|nr:B12-binding domain-containing radical SAM protein [Planctomycetota bacterium]
MARVVLIYPKPNRIQFDTAHSVNLGLAYMAAALEKRGHSVAVHDCNLEADTQLIPKIRDAELICFYTITAALKASQRWAEIIKTQHNADCKIILGGPHPTARPEDCFASPHVDYAALGEGEILVCDLIENLNNPAVRDALPGLCRRSALGTVISNGKAIFPPDLDALPFPAYHYFPIDRVTPTRPTWINARGLKCGSMMTSRGCPFKCTFCTSAADQAFGKKFRAMSPARVVEEMEWLHCTYGIEFIEFQDDVFNLITSRAEEICRLLIKKNMPVRWSIPNGISRVENITESFMRLCKKAGWVDAWFAAETGSDRIRNDIIFKQNTMQQVRDAIAASKRAGLQTGAFFIFGSADETLEEMQATIDFACSLPLDRAQFTIATPFLGTLWSRIEKEGRWLVKDFDYFGPYENVVYYELGRLKAENVLRMYKKAFRRFFLRPSYLLRKVALRKETYTNMPLLVKQAYQFMT